MWRHARKSKATTGGVGSFKTKKHEAFRGERFLKKSCVLRQRIQMKYAIIKEESGRFSLKLMCRMLSVSVSGYYAWLHRKPSAHKRRDHELSKKIKTIFDDEKGRSGAPRVTKRLNR